MRVLVCGGRKFNNIDLLGLWMQWLWQLSREGVTLVIEGGADGADKLARLYAEYSHIPVQTYEAKWKSEGKAAGPIRNQRMLDEGKPDIVLCMLGGKGTADMVRRAKKAGILVIGPGK